MSSLLGLRSGPSLRVPLLPHHAGGLPLHVYRVSHQRRQRTVRALVVRRLHDARSPPPAAALPAGGRWRGPERGGEALPDDAVPVRVPTR